MAAQAQHQAVDVKYADVDKRSMKEKFYDICHYTVVGSIALVTLGGVFGILFLLYQVNGQRRRNNKSTENSKLLKRVFSESDLSQKSVKELRAHFGAYVGGDGKVSISDLEKDPDIARIAKHGVDINRIFSWAKNPTVELEIVCYTLWIAGYFCGREEEQDNPQNRKAVGNVIYNMLVDYEGAEPRVSNVAAYINTCFNLGFLSDPNLGGLEYDDWILDYSQFMLGDESLAMSSVVELPMFRIFNRVPVYHLGLVQEKKKKKVYDSQAPQHGMDKPGRPGYVPHAGENNAGEVELTK